jgi:GT2 family glycosyltransferase
MTTHSPTVSVVVCCYADERFRNVLAAVESLRLQTSPPTEVAVVVDYNPALLEHVKAAAADVLTLGNDQPKGLSGARNSGIAATGGDIVAFLDDDAVAEPEWLERLLAPYADPQVAGVGGAIVADWLTGRPSWFPDEFDWVVGCTYRGMPAQRAPVRNLIGANMSFRRDIFTAAGVFDVEMGRTGSYPQGNDDTEFSIRARRALPGHVLLYEPQARVWHGVPAQRATWGYFKMRCYAEGLAKAALTTVSGSTDGLSSERAYAARTLPRGVTRSLREALAGDGAGAKRSLTIVAGLLITFGGYARGRLRPHLNGHVASEHTRDLSGLTDRPRRRGGGAFSRVRAARALPRSHGATRAALGIAPVALALLLWGVSLGRIDLGRISDFGLLPALPWTYYAALGVLTISFAVALRASRTPETILALHVVALILIVHATPSIAYGTLRYAWAWKHVGIVDYIQRHGSVDSDIQFLSAYHNWPGFFALTSLYTQLAGFRSALSFASWAPVFFNLLFLGALVVLFRALTRDRRRVWLGAWFFFAANWIGQDYFSPQAYAYFLFLIVVTVGVAWFRLRQPPDAAAVRRVIPWRGGANWFHRLVSRANRGGRWHADAGQGERGALALLLLLLTVAIASSHQLTPFMTILALGGLVLSQQIRLRSLPALVAAISLAWVAFFAVGFLRGNLYWMVDSVGALTTNANSTLINLAKASYGQRVVADIDRALTLGVWVLGALGFARAYRRGRLDLAAGVLALAPFAMLAVTSYGGEILFRAYFFSLPFMAFLATGLFYPVGRSGRRLTALATAFVSCALLAGLLVGYYGKERQNHFSKDEVSASRYLYATAPPGSLLVSGVNNYPWAFEHYEEYSYLSLADLSPRDRRHVLAQPADTIAAIARQSRSVCTYVVITSSEKAAVDMTGVMPAGSLERIEHRLAAAPGYRLVLRNPSATIFGVRTRRPASRCRRPV